MCFEPTNRMAEEDAGLVKKRSEAEKVAEERAQAIAALRGMEQMVPRPSEEVFEQTREWLRASERKLKELKRRGEDPDSAMKKAMEVERQKELEKQAMLQAWGRNNPGKNVMEFGGPETQRIFENFVAPPPQSDQAAVDLFTCAYCKNISEVELKYCARCRKVVYCNRDCQKKAWKAHKKICVQAKTKDVTSASMTWDQLEALGGSTATGQTLELRAILDESMMRQVFQCKDRNGVMKRIAAYTDSRSIAGLKQGSVLKWKNPRFHYFVDGSSGARIEQSDLVNITVN